MLLSKGNESRAPSLHHSPPLLLSLSIRSLRLSFPPFSAEAHLKIYPRFAPPPLSFLLESCVFSESPSSSRKSAEQLAGEMSFYWTSAASVNGDGEGRRGNERDKSDESERKRSASNGGRLIAGVGGRNTAKTLSAIRKSRRCSYAARSNVGKKQYSRYSTAPLSSYRQLCTLPPVSSVDLRVVAYRAAVSGGAVVRHPARYVGRGTS